MKDFRTCLRGFRPLMRSVSWKVLVSILTGLVRIAASLGFVWICKRLVDIATGVNDAPLGVNIGIMAGIMLTQILCNIFRSWWESYINVVVKNDERQRIFSHVLRSVWTGRESFHSGDTINRLEEDIRLVVELVCTRVPDAVVTICQLVAASLFLLNMAPGLVWLLIALMVVGVLGSRLFFRTLRSISSAIRAKESEIQEHMQENLQNRVVVLTLIGVEKVLTKLGALQKDVRDQTVLRLNYNSVARGFMGLGFMGGYAAAFLWGVFGIRDGLVTYGMMTAFLQLVGQIQRPIADLTRHIPAFIQALASMERLMELEELPVEKEGESVDLGEAPAICIRNLDFSYPGGHRKIFDDFSCEFKSGELTAITGQTGAGKSTLIRLILALLSCDKGEILIGGKKADPCTRCNFMYVPQGNSLMSGTIRENLLLADANATEEEMREALHLAVADFVFELPDGLDTVCSEKGAGLSEGQAQRIAIARGLLHKGGVLILDEATSAVDPATELRLLENMNARFHGRKTILFISHREAVKEVADSIVEISDLG